MIIVLSCSSISVIHLNNRDSNECSSCFDHTTHQHSPTEDEVSKASLGSDNCSLGVMGGYDESKLMKFWLAGKIDLTSVLQSREASTLELNRDTNLSKVWLRGSPEELSEVTRQQELHRRGACEYCIYTTQGAICCISLSMLLANLVSLACFSNLMGCVLGTHVGSSFMRSFNWSINEINVINLNNSGANCRCFTNIEAFSNWFNCQICTSGFTCPKCEPPKAC